MINGNFSLHIYTFPMHLHTFLNFNNTLLSMLERVVSSSSLSSGGDCLWWLIVHVLDKFCGVFSHCVFVHLFFYFIFWKAQNSKKK